MPNSGFAHAARHQIKKQGADDRSADGGQHIPGIAGTVADHHGDDHQIVSKRQHQER